MIWTPQKGVFRTQHNFGSVGSTTPGVAVTTGTPSTTKGTPVELFAATDFDVFWVTIVASNYGTSTFATEGSMDILIGGATEEILIPDLLMGYCGLLADVTVGPKVWSFPLYIPAGQRLAVRAAGARVSTAFRVWMYLYGGVGFPPWRVGSRVVTVGATAPNGTSITPGASGAEGSWTQIIASTVGVHFAVVPSFQVQGDATINNRAYALDIGIGAATQKMIAESYIYTTDQTERMAGPFNPMPCFKDIPEGSELSVRVSNSSTNDSGFGAALHLVG